MLPHKGTLFLSYIYAFVLYLSIVGVDGSSSTQTEGLNHQCGSLVRATVLTRSMDRGYSLFYDVQSNSLVFLDATYNSVYRYFIDTGRYYNITVGTRDVNFVLPVEDEPDTFLISYGNDVALLKWNCERGTHSYQRLNVQDSNYPYPNYYLNEARVGRSKNKPVFFFSAPRVTQREQFPTINSNNSALYDIDNGKKKKLLSDLVSFGKGFAFSHDGKVIYYTDFIRNQTYRASYNEKTNSIENSKLFFKYKKLGIPGRLGSLTVDSEGYVWISTQRYRVLKLNPDTGYVECSIRVPAESISSIVFGKCPGSKDNLLNCLYLATVGGGFATTKWNGAIIRVEGMNATGILDYKVPLSTIFGHTSDGHTRCYK